MLYIDIFHSIDTIDTIGATITDGSSSEIVWFGSVTQKQLVGTRLSLE